VKDAEGYYRSMYRDEPVTWNVRERHMAETVEDLVEHLDPGHRRAKIAIWAHNSHLGDARVTDMRADGEVNLGQLMRRRHRCGAVLIGLTTYPGAVMAVSDWETRGELKPVPPALPGSHEAVLHAVEEPKFR
jgi:erythromycin esterase-like protein